MNTQKFNISDLVLLRDNISKREIELAQSAKKLEEAKKNINRILKETNGDSNTTVFLDISFFEDIKLNSLSLKSRFNWKGISEKILSEAKVAHTTKMIYDQAKLRYPVELADEKKSIHGFSSALSNLLKNNKIIQEKSGNKCYYSIKK
jgi:hypothetical protein